MNKNTHQGRRQTKQKLRQRILPRQVMQVVVIGGRKIYTTTTQTGWCIRKIIERIRRFFIYTTFAGRWWCIFFISPWWNTHPKGWSCWTYRESASTTAAVFGVAFKAGSSKGSSCSWERRKCGWKSSGTQSSKSKCRTYRLELNT